MTVYNATPRQKRRQQTYPTTKYRLGQWGKWMFHNDRHHLGFPAICPMFSGLLPRSYSGNDGIPPPAVKEIMDATVPLNERQRRILLRVYRDRDAFKTIAAEEEVSPAMIYKVHDRAVEIVAHALGYGVET